MPELTVVDVSEGLSLDPSRAGKIDTSVTYVVDARGPYVRHYPKDGFNFDKALQELKVLEGDRAKMIGRKIQL